MLACSFADNPVTLPGVDKNKAYVSTTNSQYHDDAEDFLCSEVFSNYGDLMVSLKVLRGYEQSRCLLRDIRARRTRERTRKSSSRQPSFAPDRMFLLLDYL